MCLIYISGTCAIVSGLLLSGLQVVWELFRPHLLRSKTGVGLKRLHDTALTLLIICIVSLCVLLCVTGCKIWEVIDKWV